MYISADRTLRTLISAHYSSAFALRVFACTNKSVSETKKTKRVVLPLESKVGTIDQLKAGTKASILFTNVCSTLREQCMLHISTYFTYPAMAWSRQCRITEVSLYINIQEARRIRQEGLAHARPNNSTLEEKHAGNRAKSYAT